MARGSSTLAVPGSAEAEADAGLPPIPRPAPAPPPHAASPDAERAGHDAVEPVDPAARTSLTPTRPRLRQEKVLADPARPPRTGPPAATPPAADPRPAPERPAAQRPSPEPVTRTVPVRPSPRPRPRPAEVPAAGPAVVPAAAPAEVPAAVEEDPRTTTVARSALAATDPATRTIGPGTEAGPPVETGPPTAPHTAVTESTAVPAAAAPAAPARGAADLAEAEDFLRMFHEENPAAGSLASRLAAVRDEVAETGTYVHTTAELEYGARVAWRNSARCIGRLYWRSLHLRDRRDVVDAEGVADECVAHLRDATRRGRIRSTITVFAPDTPTAPGPRIWNEQLVRYAGYRAGGAVLGDPRYVGFTDTARSLGWVPPSPMGGFDVLPLVVSGGGDHAAEGPHLAEIPTDAVMEVPLSHPDHEWFAELGLQWHAVPAISNMRLDIGGVSYPAAPFNGWYMATEIGARNLADPERYDLLGEIAEAMGLDTSNDRTLWRDRAAVELTLAVQHSYDTAGVTLADHHGESQRFLRHVDREEAAGRSCPVDWSWIVPPISGALTPVFHRYYDEPTDTGPMFRLDDTALARGRGCPV